MSSWPLMGIPSGAGTMPFAPAVDKQDWSALPYWTVALRIGHAWTARQGRHRSRGPPHGARPRSPHEASGPDPGQDGWAADGHVLTRALPTAVLRLRRSGGWVLSPPR